MKIVFINDTVFGYASGAPVVGGAERQQWLLARALAAGGWAVSVGVRDGLAERECRGIDGVRFVGLGRGPVVRAWSRFLAEENPDWWYWRCASHLWGVAVEVAALNGVGTIFAAGVDSDVRPRRALYRRPRWWPLYAWGLFRAQRIFVQHEQQLAALPRWLQHRASVVPSIAGDALPMRPHGERERYVAWVAMLRQPKRPDLLIEIARRAPAIQFVVCGGVTDFASPDGYGSAIRAELERTPNVRFLGQVSPEESRQVIGNAALLLSTSDAEGFPNTFLEAWAAGTPVVSLSVDPGRVIERSGLGRVVGTTERAATDLQSLLRAPDERDAIGARARRYVAAAHSARAVAAVVGRVLGSTSPEPAIAPGRRTAAVDR
jgi:glycosyltransferase involved in cell wall biosynthesis